MTQEFHQYTGANLAETIQWLAHRFVFLNLEDSSITIERKTGRERVQLDEWMVKTGIDVHVWQPHTFSRRVGRDGMVRL